MFLDGVYLVLMLRWLFCIMVLGLGVCWFCCLLFVFLGCALY